MKGKTIPELQAVLPGAGAQIEGWRGFASLYLWFDDAKRLNQLNLSFKEPIAESEAYAIALRVFGLDLRKFPATRAPSAVRFQAPHPALKSATLSRAIPSAQIEGITLTFSPGQ